MTLSRRQQQAIEHRFRQLAEAASEHVFELEGTPSFDVKYPDGIFRRKAVPTNIGYQLAYIYLGSSGKPILGFRPEYAHEFDTFECEAARLDKFMPLLGAELSTFTSLETPIESLPVLLQSLAKTAVHEFDEAEKRAAEDALKNYDNIPEFGAF